MRYLSSNAESKPERSSRTQSVRFAQRVLTLALLLCARAAAAQSARWGHPQRRKSSSCSHAFHLSAEYLSDEDIMFVWDTNFGGELDVIEYGTAGPRSSPTTRPSSATSSATSIPTRATTSSPDRPRCGPRRRRGRRACSPSVAPPGRPRQSRGRCLEHDGRTSAEDLHGSAARASDYARVDRPRRRRRSRSWITAGRLKRGRAQRRADSARSACCSTARCDISAWTVRRIAGIRRVSGQGGVRFAGAGRAMEFFLAGERRIDPYPLEFGTAGWDPSASPS